MPLTFVSHSAGHSAIQTTDTQPLRRERDSKIQGGPVMNTHEKSMYIPLYLIQQTRNTYKKKEHSCKRPCHDGQTGNIYTKSYKAPALKQGFASYNWNMSKAVAKIGKKKEKKKNSLHRRSTSMGLIY